MTGHSPANYREISVDSDPNTRRFNFANPLESALVQGDVIFFINNGNEEVVALSAPFTKGNVYPSCIIATQRIGSNVFHSGYTSAQEGGSYFMVSFFGPARVDLKNPAFNFYDKILRSVGR